MVEQQVELSRELDRAMEQMNLPALSNILHPDYVHITRPQSVNIPKRNKDQTLEYWGGLFSNWATIGTPVSTVLANTPGKIVVHIISDITLKSGSTITYESFIAMEIDEDASGNRKIKHVEEFIDANAHSQGFAPFLEGKA